MSTKQIKNKIVKLDNRLLFFFNRNQDKRLTVFMMAMSLVGNGGLLWFFIGILMLFNSFTSKYGLYVLSSLGVCALVNNLIIKNIINRPRPCDIYKSVPLYIKRPFGSSFPSGHTATSFTSATALCTLDIRIGLIALFVACLIAISRIYLFAHFPSDVILGTVSGVVFSIAGIHIVKFLLFIFPIPYFLG